MQNLCEVCTFCATSLRPGTRICRASLSPDARGNALLHFQESNLHEDHGKIGATRCSLGSNVSPDMLPPDVDLADSEVDLAEPPDLAMPMDLVVTPPDLALPGSPTLRAVTPASGLNSATTNLTLTGTNFRAGATVTVGGQTCSNPAVVSATQSTCTAPARTATCGLQSVVVTNLIFAPRLQPLSS